MTTLWCFQCGAEYREGVEECIECGVGLVTERPLDPDAVGASTEDQLAYELHDWSFESRRMLDQLLTGQGVAHAWQGATMIVRAADEAAVDALVEEVEHATLPTLDSEREHTVYEMADWTAEQQTRLSSMLGLDGIPHEFDMNGDLVVHAEDEEAVDRVLDRLEDAITRGDDDGDALHIDDDLQVNDILSNAFAAADRLKNNTRDHEAVLSFIDASELIDKMAVPYGFERADWHDVRATVLSLTDALEADDPDEEVIAERARAVRTHLVRII